MYRVQVFKAWWNFLTFIPDLHNILIMLISLSPINSQLDFLNHQFVSILCAQVFFSIMISTLNHIIIYIRLHFYLWLVWFLTFLQVFHLSFMLLLLSFKKKNPIHSNVHVHSYCILFFFFLASLVVVTQLR